MKSAWVAITGVSKGLGAALVQQFWKDGVNLLLIGKSNDALTSILADLPRKENQKAAALVCNLASPKETEALAFRLQTDYPYLDVLVNNAAIQGPIGVAWDNDFNDWQQTIQVNLVSPVALCRAVIKGMIKRGSGSIINLSGGGATSSRPNFSAYASAKAGLVRFSETLADEARVYGVRVNCIAPGAMRTDMLKQVLAMGPVSAGEREFSVAKRVMTEGGVDFNQVAELVKFLAMEKSQGITGKLISSVWDQWDIWPEHLDELTNSDVYTLRRITGKDRGCAWGDK